MLKCIVCKREIKKIRISFENEILIFLLFVDKRIDDVLAIPFPH